MKTLFFSLNLLFVIGTTHLANAEPVVIGDPSKGTPITSVVDGKNKVQITTSGISVDKGDEDEEAGVTAHHGRGSHHLKSLVSELEDILVPLFFFVFLIAVILGKRYFESRNDERRMQLLKMMVEKGQPVPESALQLLLSPQTVAETGGARQGYKRTRNAYGFTLAGMLLIGHALINHDWQNQAVLIPGLIFICLGLGGFGGIYLPKRSGTTLTGQ